MTSRQIAATGWATGPWPYAPEEDDAEDEHCPDPDWYTYKTEQAGDSPTYWYQRCGTCRRTRVIEG